MNYHGSLRRSSGQRGPMPGFTLLEVLAAVAIMGVALFVLLEAHYAAMNLNVSVSEEVILRQLAETVIAKAEVEVLAGNLTDAGDFGERYADYRWSFDAVEAGSDEMVLLYSVMARVEGPIEERSYEFYVYDTSMTDQNPEGTGATGASDRPRQSNQSENDSRSQTRSGRSSGEASARSSRSGARSSRSRDSRSSDLFGGSSSSSRSRDSNRSRSSGRSRSSSGSRLFN